MIFKWSRLIVAARGVFTSWRPNLTLLVKCIQSAMRQLCNWVPSFHSFIHSLMSIPTNQDRSGKVTYFPPLSFQCCGLPKDFTYRYTTFVRAPLKNTHETWAPCQNISWLWLLSNIVLCERGEEGGISNSQSCVILIELNSKYIWIFISIFKHFTNYFCLRLITYSQRNTHPP